MSNNIVKTGIVAPLLAAGIILTATANGASARGFGGADFGHGASGGHVTRFDPTGQHVFRSAAGGYPSPMQVGNRPSGNGRTHDAPRAETRPTTRDGDVQSTASRSPELSPGASSRILGRGGAVGTLDEADHAPREIHGQPRIKPGEADL